MRRRCCSGRLPRAGTVKTREHFKAAKTTAVIQAAMKVLAVCCIWERVGEAHKVETVAGTRSSSHSSRHIIVWIGLLPQERVHAHRRGPTSALGALRKQLLQPVVGAEGPPLVRAPRVWAEDRHRGLSRPTRRACRAGHDAPCGAG